MVTAFTDNVVQPLINRIGASPDRDYGILRIPLGDNIFIDLNAVLSAFINFLIVAAVIYFVIIVPYKKLKELDTKVEEEETELTLLTEIRDLMRQNAGLDAVAPSNRHGTAAAPTTAPGGTRPPSRIILRPNEFGPGAAGAELVAVMTGVVGSNGRFIHQAQYGPSTTQAL